MNTGMLEHVNITVSDPKKTADLLTRLFDWKIRWSGKAKDDGYTYHVGTENSYLAVYTLGTPKPYGLPTGSTLNGLNHVGVVVEDLDDTEKRIIEEGFTPNSHGDYEPGKRFYFEDNDGIEFEVISYADGSTSNG